MEEINYFYPWIKQNINRFEAILLDIDGTLVHGQNGLPGAQQLLQYLRTIHFPFLLLTNDANHSREEKIQLLKKRQIDVFLHEVVSAGQVLKNVAKEKQLQNTLAYVLGDLGNPCFAESAGFKITRNPLDAINCQSVIVGEGDYDWMTAITAAINAISIHPKILLISPNPDTYWPSHHHFIGIGAGGVAQFIQLILKDAGIEKEILFLGKPYPPIFHFALQQLALQFHRPIRPENCLMLGDNLLSDISGALRYKMNAGIVLTGVTKRPRIAELSKENQPNYIFTAIEKA